MFRFAVSRDLLESDPTAAISKKTVGGANVERDRVLDEREIRELALKLSKGDVNIVGVRLIVANHRFS